MKTHLGILPFGMPTWKLIYKKIRIIGKKESIFDPELRIRKK